MIKPIDIKVEECVGLVKNIALKMHKPAYGHRITLEDLISAGIFGLMKAAKSYIPGDVPFHYYARFRIRGEILDELRRLDPATRPQREKHKKSRSEDPLIVLNYIGELGIRDISDLNASEVEDNIERKIDMEMMVDYLEALPSQERKVLKMYYISGLYLHEIGNKLGVGESRASQIKVSGIKSLRKLISVEI